MFNMKIIELDFYKNQPAFLAKMIFQQWVNDQNFKVIHVSVNKDLFPNKKVVSLYMSNICILSNIALNTDEINFILSFIKDELLKRNPFFEGNSYPKFAITLDDEDYKRMKKLIILQ